MSGVTMATALSGCVLASLALLATCGGAEPGAAIDGGAGGAGGADAPGTGGSCPYRWPCPQCGDGTLDPEEACDDGNALAGDGCNGLCQVETGWDCSAPPCAQPEPCGDGQVSDGHACDDANRLDGDGCSADCLRIEPGWYCPAAGSPCKPTGDLQRRLSGDPCATSSPCIGVCGNGLVDGDEACDDGIDPSSGVMNDGRYGGCTADCRLAPHCGDGLVEGLEACDVGERNGLPSGPDTCTPACANRYCGDGHPDGDLGEECDLGARNGQPGQGCDSACRNVATPRPCPVCI